MRIIELFKSLFKKNHSHRIKKIKFLKNSAVKLNNNLTIDIRGDFQFNRKWTNIDPFPSLLFMDSESTLIVNGKFSIYSGSRVYINSGASLILGSGYINHNLNLSCFDRIEIGEDVAISENVCIRDSDNHEILNSSHKITKPIKIGNKVWIGMNVTILKGVTLGDGCIIAANSLVNKDIPPFSLAGGVPAKVLKRDIMWK
jgi:acetyltransferase-like isoleucine patch superfamily enzyme